MSSVEKPEIYWDTKLEASSLTATTASSGFGADKLVDGDRLSPWRASTLDPNVLQADFPSNSIQDAAALILENHNLNGLELSLVTASSLDFFDASTIDTFTVNTTGTVLRRFDSETFASAKLNIPLKAGSFAEIGELYLGPRLEFESNPIAPFDPDERMTVNISRDSEAGRNVTLPRFQKRVVSMILRTVSNSFYGNINDWWINRGATGKSFWWSFRPQTDPSKTFYARADMRRLRFPFTPFRRDGTLQLVEEL